MDYSEYNKKYERISFYDQIANNKWKSWFLLIMIVLIIVALAYVISQIYNPSAVFAFLIIGIIISLLYVWLGYYYSDKIALASVNAQEADPIQFRPLHNIVEGLTIAAGLPKPKIYIMPSKEINAFATGRDPEHAVICVSVGAMQNLTKKEMESVIAHEMTHIANYDIRFVTLVVVLVGLIAIISEIFLRSLWFSGSNDNKNGNAVFLIIGIALAILAPIVANLVQLAISRKREYMADAGAVQLVRDNSGLISALKKIDAFYNSGQKSIVNKEVSTMMIANPFSGKSLSALFSTHPPIEERIKALERM